MSEALGFNHSDKYSNINNLDLFICTLVNMSVGQSNLIEKSLMIFINEG